MSSRQNFPICYDCQKTELEGEIKDPEMKKMFAISEEFYKENMFLRNIKSNYLSYGELTERPIAAFKKVAKDMKAKVSEEKKKQKLYKSD